MKSEAQQKRPRMDTSMRKAWMRKACGYVRKHRGMTRIGLVIGVSFAIPAVARGAAGGIGDQEDRSAPDFTEALSAWIRPEREDGICQMWSSMPGQP